jgi:uncharacterized membrane protein HdeD (DUF308 family)
MTTTASNREIRMPAPGWWSMLLIEGIVILVLGLALFLAPAMALFVLVQLLGIYYWLVTGILSIASIFVDSRMWFLKLLAGLLGIAAGIIVNQHPVWSALLVPTTLTLILGIIGIGVGVLHLVRVFKGAGWGAAALGVLNLGLGVLILMMSLLATLVLIYAIATWLVLMGILTIVAAFMTRSAQKKQVALRRPEAAPPAPSV